MIRDALYPDAQFKSKIKKTGCSGNSYDLKVRFLIKSGESVDVNSVVKEVLGMRC